MPTATITDLPTLPTVDIADVELCKVGYWEGSTGGYDYTHAELEGLIRDHAELQAAGWDVPVTLSLGHDGEGPMGDGDPALGWVGEIRLDGDSLRGNYHKVPAKLAQLMQSGAYPKRSATFLAGATIGGKKRKLVLRNIALLGGHQPAVDGLEDIFPLYNKRRLAAAPDHGGELFTLADEKPFKTEGGAKFHVPDYAYTPDDNDPSTWKLRITKSPGGAPDAGMVGAAIAAFGKGFRGQKASISTADRGAVKSRLRGAWTRANPDKSEDDMPSAIQNSRDAMTMLQDLARLSAEARAGYQAWKAAHPRMYQLVSGPPMSDIQSAVEKALDEQYPPAKGDDETEESGQDGPSCNVLDWFVSGDQMSVIVSDQDVDNLFEIPFTYDAGQDAAQLGAPTAVKGTYTPVTGGGESGGEADEGEPAEGTPDATAEADAEPDMQQMRRLLDRYELIEGIAQLAKGDTDSDVERLITTLQADLDEATTKLNTIAAGKAGVTELRTLLKMLQRGLTKFGVPKESGASPSAASASPPTKKAQNARSHRQSEEETDMAVLAEFARKLGLPETATQAEIERRLDGALASADAVITLARRMDERDARDAEDRIREKLAAAVKEGRLHRWSKPGEDGELYTQLLKLGRMDFATFQTTVDALHPFIDVAEHGFMGDADGAPDAPADLRPGVARELKRLGRDPATLSRESLPQRWDKLLAEKEAKRAEAFGIPPRGLFAS